MAKEEQEEEEKEEASLINSENKRESVWQVVCFTQQDWSRLVEKFRDSVIISPVEKKRIVRIFAELKIKFSKLPFSGIRHRA